ncbi:MAG TPA: ABC transporter permease subunit [Limnochordia bacterium]
MGHSARPAASSIPFWRNVRVLGGLIQVAFLIGIAAFLWLLVANVRRGLAQLGIGFSFGFLGEQAGFAISEGIAYTPTDTYLRALVVGLVNSLRICALGIVLATAIGVVMGVARLSTNWLVRTLALAYVEIVRNTPLLLQLFFWYGAVVLSLPSVRRAYEWLPHVHLSQRGLFLPRPLIAEGFPFWVGSLVLSAAAACAVYVWRVRRLRRLDRPGFPLLWAAAALLGGGALGWALAPGSPLAWEVPVLRGFNFRGGMALSPEFTAVLLGLACYTGAFIAEIVRGGIQAVDRGQREAARALGLVPWQVLYLVVLPQALRVIIPPVTSQYLNLIKNSSLGVATGFPELFSVGTTILNQTGQAIPVFAVIMLIYLIFSLITSLFMNWYNRRIRLVER